MSILYKKKYCANCGRDQSGRISTLQYFLFFFLLALFIIPGLIYFFCAKPARCHICGLKKKDMPKSTSEKRVELKEEDEEKESKKSKKRER